MQLAAFGELFGRAPDFVDGHQHVQLYPQVRDAFLAAVKEAAPYAWVRQCGRIGRWAQEARLRRKALLLDVLSAQFRQPRRRAGIAFNPAFAGAYDFSQQPDFGALMRQFLDGLPERGVIMCHPGFVDDVLIGLDPLHGQREHEHAFFGGEQFPAATGGERRYIGLSPRREVFRLSIKGLHARRRTRQHLFVAYINLIPGAHYLRHKPPLHSARASMRTRGRTP